MAKDLVQNPDFGNPNKPSEPTHIWVDRPTPDPGIQFPSGGGGTDYGAAGLIFLPFVLLAFLPLAYPISTVVIFVTWWVCNELSQARFRGIGDGPRWVLLFVPAFIVFVICMRTEQRLGAWNPYRWFRHLLRLLVPALLLVVVAQNDKGGHVDPDLSTFFSHIASDHELLYGVLVAMVIMQVLYWIGGWVRDWWHASLRFVWLRSAKLKD